MIEPVVLGLASLPGAGKSQLVEHLELLGVYRFHVGDVVRQTAREHGFKPAGETREDYLPFWAEHSQRHGKNWLAKLAFDVSEERDRVVVVDGVRIEADAQTISEHQTMFWLDADLDVLAGRVIARAKPEDGQLQTPEAYKEAMERDLADEGHFAMGSVRRHCNFVLPAVPEIADEVVRAEHYHHLATHLLALSAVTPADLRR